MCGEGQELSVPEIAPRSGPPELSVIKPVIIRFYHCRLRWFSYLQQRCGEGYSAGREYLSTTTHAHSAIQRRNRTVSESDERAARSLNRAPGIVQRAWMGAVVVCRDDEVVVWIDVFDWVPM